MVDAMAEKYGWERLYVSFNYSYARYILVKILSAKLKILHTSACLKLS